MDTLASIQELVRHGASANDIVMQVVAKLSDEQLDRPLDLGMGSVRKIVQHILAGEVTWLERIKGNTEAKWPARPIPEVPAAMHSEFRATAEATRAFVAGLKVEQLGRVQRYRDSKGSVFEATLHEMLMQLVQHSAHHRAQAVNGIRRVGGEPPELDYMYSVRRPVS